MESVPDPDLTAEAQRAKYRADLEAARRSPKMARIRATADASSQLAMLHRLRRILEVYCTGHFVFQSDSLEWVYLSLRNAIFRVPTLADLEREPNPYGIDHAGLDYAALAKALPESLSGGIDPLAAPDIWRDYLAPAIDGFRGAFLSECSAADIWPFDRVADETVGTHLGYDQVIGDYEEVKAAAQRAFGEEMARGGGLAAMTAAANDAAASAARVIWRRNHPEDVPDEAARSATPSAGAHRSPSTRQTRASRRRVTNATQARALRDEGRTIKEIAGELRVSESSVYNYLHDSDDLQ